MSIPKIGYDLSVLNNIEPPNLSFPKDPAVIIESLSRNTSNLTQGLFGFGALTVIGVTSFLNLSKSFQEGGFGYSSLRALALSLLNCSILAWVMIEVGFINNFIVVSLFTFTALFALLYLYLVEQK